MVTWGRGQRAFSASLLGESHLARAASGYWYQVHAAGAADVDLSAA